MKEKSFLVRSDFIEYGIVPRLYVLAILFGLLPLALVVWFAYPTWPFYMRMLFSVGVVTICLYHVIKNRRMFKNVLRRLLGGPATITIDQVGFHSARRIGSTTYPWSAVEKIDLAVHDAQGNAGHYIVFFLEDGRDVWLASNDKWSQMEVIRGWLGGALAELPIRVVQYDEGAGDFVEVASLNEKYA